MTVEELFAEIASRDSHLAHLQQAEHEDYEVHIDDDAGEDFPVKGVRWDHDRRRMILEVM